ncbi:MAG TPA: PAS domain S-box protein, partial [Stellaceae bacterium]|nr:PAS domain S-box protein [Stellaceae bacterium]
MPRTMLRGAKSPVADANNRNPSFCASAGIPLRPKPVARILASTPHPITARHLEKSRVRRLPQETVLSAGLSEILNDAKQFQFLLEALADHAIVMLDTNGIVVRWNFGAQRITGYRSGEIVGQNFSCFFTPEDRDGRAPAAFLRQAEAEGRAEREGWRVRKDGGRFWASSVIEAIRDESGALLGFAEITRDSTRRHEAEAALRESEQQFRRLVEGVTDHALYMLDPGGIITSWNAGAQRIKGYTESEIVGRHFSCFYTERDRLFDLPAHALSTAAQEGRFEAEGWRVRKDG